MNSTNVATVQKNSVSDTNSPGGMLSGFLPIIIICGLFYFLIMRPQQKREAKKREKINQLKKGDFVVTNGGIIGKVEKVSDNANVTLEISEGVVVKVYKNFIAEVLDAPVELVAATVKDVKKGKTVKKPKKEEKIDETSETTK